ncbi:hypothetical protein [Eggerthella sp. YY7918]|uniref:hypothetical protein n=1 Tax=Eggerthella sp. (strain YY7918) TaxID=502558 RepID=UPI0002171709|nr:hypothetical protein [Eggerthella sp. YY7918]BAK44475.1 hypothetical protein EGYY_13230 [Eggerthella sp. YY7918]
MKNRDGVYAAIAVASFVLMTGSLILTYSNAGEGGVGIGELVPSLGFALLFLVNLVLSRQNRRR